MAIATIGEGSNTVMENELGKGSGVSDSRPFRALSLKENSALSHLHSMIHIHEYNVPLFNASRFLLFYY